MPGINHFMKETETRSIPLDSDEAKKLFGSGDANLRKICSLLGVSAVYRNGQLVFTGKKRHVSRTLSVVDKLRDELRVSGVISEQSINKALDFPEKHDQSLEINVPGRAGCIIPRTPGQEYYLRCIGSSSLGFCIGPAGTGKTFLAVARGGRESQVTLSRGQGKNH